MSGEAYLVLPTGDRERVQQDTIGGQLVSMESVVLIEPSEIREYDADQHLTYIGKSILRGSTTDPIWMIWKIAYDANFNELSRLRASNAFNQKWSERAGLTYL